MHLKYLSRIRILLETFLYRHLRGSRNMALLLQLLNLSHCSSYGDQWLQESQCLFSPIDHVGYRVRVLSRTSSYIPISICLVCFRVFSPYSGFEPSLIYLCQVGKSCSIQMLFVLGQYESRSGYHELVHTQENCPLQFLSGIFLR